jgi:Chalcone isomerase-like
MKRAFILVLALASPALAAQRAGVDMPDTVKAADKTLVLNGIGVRQATIFNVKVYVAGLYVESKSTNPDELIRSAQVKRLDLVFVRDVDRDDITAAWLKGFKNNGADMNKLHDRISQLNAWMPDLKKKDTMSFLYVPDKGVSVTVNGVAKGTIAGADFASALFGIWLGRDPADDDLKKGLLGK